MDIDLNKNSKIKSITVGQLIIPLEEPISIEELETVTKIDFQNITPVTETEEKKTEGEELNEWQNKEEIKDFLKTLTSKGQAMFTKLILESTVVEKGRVEQEFKDEGLNWTTYSLVGIQSSITRNAENFKNGKEKFWLSGENDDGNRFYELKEKYR